MWGAIYKHLGFFCLPQFLNSDTEAYLFMNFCLGLKLGLSPTSS